MGMPDIEPQLRRRILIIDDNEAIHRDFRKIFQPKRAESALLDDLASDLFGGSARPADGPEFELSSALQGQEGLAMVRAATELNRPYMMAFVDVRMPPGWDGVETTAKLW